MSVLEQCLIQFYCYPQQRMKKYTYWKTDYLKNREISPLHVIPDYLIINPKRPSMSQGA